MSERPSGGCGAVPKPCSTCCGSGNGYARTDAGYFETDCSDCDGSGYTITRGAPEETDVSDPMRAPEDVLATMAAQRAAGWPDWHPEDYCHRCGGRNASWWVDSDRFNAAMGKPAEHRWNGIVCPGCFVELHEAATGLTASWRLVPDPPFRHIGNRP